MNLIRNEYKNDINEFRNKPNYTIGKVIRQGNMKGNYAVLEYKINNNQSYTIKQDCGTNDIEEGEYYKVVYDTLYYKNSYVLFQEPIFLENENINTNCGKIFGVENGYKVRI